jgi:hypothetical protein
MAIEASTVHQVKVKKGLALRPDRHSVEYEASKRPKYSNHPSELKQFKTN